MLGNEWGYWGEACGVTQCTIAGFAVFTYSVFNVQFAGGGRWSGLTTGVDKGGPGPLPPMAGQFFFVTIEGLLKPVVLNLSFRVRSNAMFTSERRY